MSEYRVLVRFADLQDNKHVYEVGDKFPHSGISVNEKRLAELAGSDNRIGRPIIKYIPDENKKPKPKAKGEKNADRAVSGIA